MLNVWLIFNNKLVNQLHTPTKYPNLLVSQFYDFPCGKKKRIDIFLVAWSPAVICQYHLLCWVVASYDGRLIYKNANTPKYAQLLIFWYRIMFMYLNTWWCKPSYEREANIYFCKCFKENYHNVVTLWLIWIQIRVWRIYSNIEIVSIRISIRFLDTNIFI